MESHFVELNGQTHKYEIYDEKLKINDTQIPFDPKYKIQSYAGSGGNAIVFKAIDTLLNRYVAIKIWIDRSTHRYPTSEKYLAEIRKISLLNSPRIAHIYDAQIAEGAYYIAIYEFVDGITLKEWLRTDETIEKRQIISDRIFLEILECHKKGVFHGDLHSNNVMITGEEDIKIIDFGTSIFCRDFDPLKRERRLLLQTGKELFPEAKEMQLLDEASLLTAPAPCIPLTLIQLPKLVQVLSDPPNENGFADIRIADIYFTSINEPFVETPFFDFRNFMSLMITNYSPTLVCEYLDCLAGMMIAKGPENMGFMDFGSHLDLSEETISFFESAYSLIRSDHINKIQRDYPL